MTPPCDQCDAYHRLGFDLCPACQCTPDEPRPPATPLTLILSLEDAMRHAQDEGRIEPYQLAVWIALAQTARRRLQEARVTNREKGDAYA